MKNQLVLNKGLLKRRKFISSTAAAGTLVTLGTAVGPLQAVAKELESSGLDLGVRSSSPSYTGTDLSKICVDQFADLVGQSFRLRPAGGAVTRAKLIEVTASQLPRSPRNPQPQFSLVFDVPPGLERAQGHYRIRHPRVGTLELFMVPVDLPSKHSRLEAVFA